MTVHSWISFHSFFVWKGIQYHASLCVSRLTLRNWLWTESPSALVHGATRNLLRHHRLLFASLALQYAACTELHRWRRCISSAGYLQGKYQLLSPVAPCAALRLHFWDILGTVKNNSVTAATTSPFPAPFPKTRFVSHYPSVFWWGTCLRWLPTTVPAAGHHHDPLWAPCSSEGFLLSAEDVCHGRDIHDIHVCPPCSSPRQHLSLPALQGIVGSTQ